MEITHDIKLAYFISFAFMIEIWLTEIQQSNWLVTVV